MSAASKPNYADQVEALARTLGPGVHHVEVRHDAWCDQLSGRGPCNCNPEVVPRKEKTQ
jgi:hypothetical protein